jgi:hypothetical protein
MIDRSGNEDEVTTTYGSIQLSLEQSYSAGQKTEQERIIKLIVDLREDSAGRCDDYEAGEDDALSAILRAIKGETA